MGLRQIKTEQGKVAKRMWWSLGMRVAQRFARRRDGAVAIEFALVAAPLLALTFAIIETAFVFWAEQTLEAAATDSGRLIMTGQAQTQGFDQSAFKAAVCSNIVALFDCSNGVYVDVETYSSFSSINTAPPISNGSLDTTNFGYAPGTPGDIVIVSLYYQWPIYVTIPLINLNPRSHLLTATTVFRVEPYK